MSISRFEEFTLSEARRLRKWMRNINNSLGDVDVESSLERALRKARVKVNPYIAKRYVAGRDDVYESGVFEVETDNILWLKQVAVNNKLLDENKYEVDEFKITINEEELSSGDVVLVYFVSELFSDLIRLYAKKYLLMSYDVLEAESTGETRLRLLGEEIKEYEDLLRQNTGITGFTPDKHRSWRTL